MQYTGVYSRI